MKNTYFIVLFLLNQTSFAFNQKDLEDILAVEDLKALQQIILSTSASCLDRIVTNQGDLAFAKNELMEVAKGLAEVISESVLTLALKKDYPTACHVLSKGLLNDIEASQNSRSKCIIHDPVFGGCIYRQEQQYPVYSYYWPKYFIEVAQKGNDPFPAFADGNKLYAANRKLANELAGFVDLKGPYELAGMVVLGSPLVRAGTSAVMGQGFDLNTTRDEVEKSVATAVLTPFEKLRIRANQTPDQTSYEVNVWPVGLSATIAQKLTVCAEGGFKWAIPGVPMTCPIAMSKDAWAYWDSGMIDYINPSAIRGIVAATNPVTCIGDNLASVAFDEYGPKESTGTREDASDKDKKTGMLSNLPSSFRGMGMCSFPILGKAEAMANQMLKAGDSFKGPWCSLWGPVVPRMSTHVQNTDFGFPAAALKFKLFAHDMFGIPRGAKERWSLAYPWEEQVSEAFIDSFGTLADVLEKAGIKKVSSEYTKALGDGRSLMLMPPGDPRMLDVFSTTQIARDSKNFAREIIYLAAMNQTASEAERQTLNAFIREGHHERTSPDAVLAQHRRDTQAVIDATAREKGEPVYVKKVYCHVKGESHGLFNRDEATFNVPIEGYGDDKFERAADPSQCHRVRGGSCIDRHPITRKCRRPESVFYVSLEKWEVSHYRQVQNPRRYVLDAPKCVFEQYRTPSIHHRHYTCKERLREIGREDTRDHIPLPDPNNPEATLVQGAKAGVETASAGREVATAARISTWVGAEIARAKYEDISGKSLLPGKKRVYTIFEKIKCEPKTIEGRPVFKKKIPGGWYWNSCKDAVKLEVRKYFQTKLLRRVCDKILGQKLGEPFK